jgi:outer membrane protein
VHCFEPNAPRDCGNPLGLESETMNTRTLAALFLGLLITTGLMPVASADNVKIAFVDLRRALNETTEGKAAMDELTRLKKKLQKKIEKKEAKILELKEKLEKQANILSQEALKGQAEEYYRQVNELQQTYMQFQQELTKKESEHTQGILIKMQEIIAQIGRKEGYTMIYDRASGAVVWAPSHLDLTDKLVQMYNAKYKGKKGKK